MKLFKIKLVGNTFWFLDNIVSLNPNNKTSKFISVDSLSVENIEAIDKSAHMLEIKLFDFKDNRVYKLSELGYFNGDFSIDTNDIKEDESDLMPELFSMTIENKEEEEEVQDIEPSEDDITNAKILLNKNGNTVKKTISQIDMDLKFLYACLEVEQNKLNRSGVIKAIDEQIARL